MYFFNFNYNDNRRNIHKQHYDVFVDYFNYIDFYTHNCNGRQLYVWSTTQMNVDNALLLDVRYSGDLNKVQLYFYDRSQEKIVVWTDNTNFHPYCLGKYIAKSEALQLEKSWSYKGNEIVKKIDLLSGQEEEYVKLYGRNPLDINTIRKIVKYTYEDNIRYHLNYIYDKDLLIGHAYTIKDDKLYPKPYVAEPEILKLLMNKRSEYVDFGFHSLRHYFSEFEVPKMVAMDIEVDDSHGFPNVVKADKRMLSCAFRDNDGKEFIVILLKAGYPKQITNYSTYYAKNETDLIKTILTTMKKYPIILTFNGDNFDLPYIHNRAIKLGIDDDLIKIKKGWGFKRQWEGHLKGRLHIDIINFFGNRSIKGYAYGNKYPTNSLDDISEALLGEKKLVHSLLIGKMGYSFLADYNIKDVRLTLGLIEKDDYQAWTLMLLFARITSLPLTDLLRHEISFWIKSMLYKEHRRKGYIIPRKEDIYHAKPSANFSKGIVSGTKYKGAYVVNPVKGVHYGTVVMDFASLYPSIIKDDNLSYETINCGHSICKHKNALRGTPYHSCIEKMGIFAYTTGFFRDIRVNYFKQKAKGDDYYKPIEQALKVFINASYGVYGSEAFSFFCLPVAESITAIAWDSIENTIKKAESMGIKVLYGDTDSVFLDKPSKQEIKALNDWSFNTMGLDLDYEKTYQILGLTDRKKNYIGVLTDGRIDMKGITAKKRNTPLIIRNGLSKINVVLKGIKDELDFKARRGLIVKAVQKTDNDIKRAWQLKKDLFAVNITLSKNPNEYVKTTPQFIKAIRGHEKEYKKGDVVSYIKTMHNGAKLVSETKTHEIDVAKYRQLLRSSAEQILDAFNISWDEVVGNKKITEYFNYTPSSKSNIERRIVLNLNDVND